ncbi:MAG: hypothetical protein V9F04_09790 [Dermatophilaceae bacterium]
MRHHARRALALTMALGLALGTGALHHHDHGHDACRALDAGHRGPGHGHRTRQ